MPADRPHELMEKAEEELQAAEALVDRHIASWIVGFHCQQIAEKVLKAVLVASGHAPKKTHDLVSIMDQVRDSGIAVPSWFSQIEDLNPFAVQLRYESLEATADFDAGQARDLARKVYEWAWIELGWNENDAPADEGEAPAS